MAGDEVRPGTGLRAQALKLVKRAADNQAITMYAAIRSAADAGATTDELVVASGLPHETVARLLDRTS